MDLSQASHPAAAPLVLDPAVWFKGCQQSGCPHPDPSGPLPPSSVIVKARCMCYCIRAMSDPKGIGNVLSEDIVCWPPLETKL